MRRLWATLLLAVIGYTLIAPALFAGPADTKLPACCRRNGKHQCATAASPNGPALQSARCISFPETNPATTPRSTAVAGSAPVVSAVLPAHPAPRCEVQSFARAFFLCATQGRAPPSVA